MRPQADGEESWRSNCYPISTNNLDQDADRAGRLPIKTLLEQICRGREGFTGIYLFGLFQQPGSHVRLRPCLGRNDRFAFGIRFYSGISFNNFKSATGVLNFASKRRTYNDSISVSYDFNAIFLITVPLLVRGSGLSFEAIRIISLNIRLKAGAALFALSTIGLQYRREGD